MSHDSALAPTPGRKRDPARNEAILEATLDVLGEVGYDATTIDAIAARAKAGKATVYRRWKSKEDLVVDAVATFACICDEHLVLHDTGSLSGDLKSLLSSSTEHDRMTSAIMLLTGLVPVIARRPELLAIVRERVIEPNRNLIASVLRRAMNRGEIAADTDIATLSLVLPAMITLKITLMPDIDRHDLVVNTIYSIILPAARAGASQETTIGTAPQ